MDESEGTGRENNKQGFVMQNKKTMRAYLNEAYIANRNEYSLRADVYLRVVDEIEQNKVRVDDDKYDMRTPNGFVVSHQDILIKNSDFYLHYMLNTGVRAKTNDATYTSGIDSVYSSKIYIVDKASHRPLYVFYDKFSVSGLFDVIKKNQSR